MKSSIYLIKTKDQKVVPALCLEVLEDYFILAQLRKANSEEISSIHYRANVEKINRGKHRRNQIKLPEKQGKDTVYIGQPKGLKYKSVVMVRKLHKVYKENLLKEIAKVSEDEIKKCKNLINQKNNKTELHEELT
ncbi:hypothetical protein DZB84_18380 [Bacillus sp. HNG]|uniref:hypothetical protein n=1 Tax=Bacillus sp. HNG TaxID=2293325 RepID=UPI000E2FF0EC|nr:hypothetical protein [Bacillus sp. HNG]RFB12718.1 hypothetical protein DZB84_18380 [Bacillus sp. HNG]